MRIHTSLLLTFLSTFIALAQPTEIQYLSGRDKDHTLDWEFYCTGGRKSNQWTIIPVPSNWEQYGFGSYNYGHDQSKSDETGLYRTRFVVPHGWEEKTVHIVFEGVMTDAEVKINDLLAGPVHQGGFYRFLYDITGLLHFDDENQLDVRVSKMSSNASVNHAERDADYWVFGGIYRPVYLKAMPREHIEHVAIDARADGFFTADIHLNGITEASGVRVRITDPDMRPVGSVFNANVSPGVSRIPVFVRIPSPRLWSPEWPDLYSAEFTILYPDSTGHTLTQRFGFRTIEVKSRDGIYINGTKVMLKGVNRHSFWPESGRCLSKEISVLDVNLIKDMNMNAVRMSHYPPDDHFLDLCDSLGLFVLDELAGWQRPPYEMEIGRKLVAEMVRRDVNHPSVIFWDNGNEGGWNTDLDNEFSRHDLQQREVLHPWTLFGKIDTDHYIDFNYGNHTGFNGKEVFLPTEFLHGLYDGGHGAGLDDFWNLMLQKPICAGGFLWALIDEAVVRTDRNGALDSDGNHAPDGIMGPFREKEGSFYTIKEIWSPIFIEDRQITGDFNGVFRVENRYHFTNLNQCRIQYSWVQFGSPIDELAENRTISTGGIDCPDIPPGQKGMLSVPLYDRWDDADALYIKAIDPHGREIFTWSWSVRRPEEITRKWLKERPGKAVGREIGDQILVLARETEIAIDKNTGQLKSVQSAGQLIPLTDGPQLAAGECRLKEIRHGESGDDYFIECTFDGQMDLIRWTVSGNGLVRLQCQYTPPGPSPYLGISFSYPDTRLSGIKWLGEGPYRVWKNRMKGTQFNIWEKEFNNTVTGERVYAYPEFKGYHAGVFWAKFDDAVAPFVVFSETEDLFLRLFTPEEPAEPRNTKMDFPIGDISFLQGISSIGTKFKKAEQLGPQSQLNEYDPRGGFPLQISLYFDFTPGSN